MAFTLAPIRMRATRWGTGRSLCLAAALWFGLCVPGSAEEKPAGPVALTALAAGELGRSSHVVLATLREHREVRGMAVARLQVERWLKGEARGEEITVLVAGPRPSPDPKRPSAAYLDRKAGATYLLFLSQGSSDAVFALENRIEVRGLEGQEKVRAVEAQVSLAAVADVGERAQRVLEHFLAALEAPGAWTRANAARELAYLSGVRPYLFGSQVRSRLGRLRDGSSAPAVISWLDALLARLPVSDGTDPAPLPSGLPTSGPPAPPRPPLPRPPDALEARLQALDEVLRSAGADAAMRALRIFRAHDEVAVRVWLVEWLAESGLASALAGLRQAYASVEEADVREAIVRAHGLLGTATDVGWVVERLASPYLRDAALLALARLRTPQALAALRRERERLAGGSPDERDVALRIEHLLGEAFEASERAAGHRFANER